METRIIKKNDTVVTISQRKVLRKDCIKIRDEFHEKNVDCFEIGEKWISKHFNNIEQDEHTGHYNFRAKLGKGIKSLVWNGRENCFKVEYGYTSKAYPKSIMIKGWDLPQQVLNEEVYQAFFKRLLPCEFSGLLFVDGKSNYDKPLKFNYREDVYDHTVSLKKAKARGYNEELLEKLGIISKTFVGTGGLRYTYGIEIETSDGLLPAEHTVEAKLNIKTEKDGSIYTEVGKENTKYGGAEFITGVLTGDAGLAQLKNLCKQLSLRTKANTTCSAHVHLGGGNYNEDFILYLYLLGLTIEDELYSYMPTDRRTKNGEDNVFCKPLKKVGIKDMKNLNQDEYNKVFKYNFKSLFAWLSSGVGEGVNCNRATNHPKGNKCGYDKNSARYCWLNLVPTYFNVRGDKSYTVEFRMFGQTTSYEKIKNWMLLCMAIVSFAENHQGAILNNSILTEDGQQVPINCENILKATYKEGLANYLVNYYRMRQSFFRSNPNTTETDYYNNDNFVPDGKIYTVKDIQEDAKKCV